MSIFYARSGKVFSPYFNNKSHLITYFDEIRFSQLMINLLRNANKFTPEQGYITVSVEHIESHVQISVEDSGIGLSA